MNLFEEQLEIEKKSRLLGRGRFRRLMQDATRDQSWMRLPSTRSIVREAVLLVANELSSHFDKVLHGAPSNKHEGVKLLIKLEADPREVAYITLAIIMDSIVLKQTYNSTALKIGKAVEDQIRFLRFKQVSPHFFEKIKKNQQARRRPVWKIRSILHSQGKRKAGVQWDLWKVSEKMRVGALCIESLIAVTGLVETDIRLKNGKGSRKMIVANEATLFWLSQMNKRHEFLSQQYMPCVLLPNEWENKSTGGGYWSGWLKGVDAVKVRRRKDLKTLDKEGMTTFYSALNTCQGTGYTLNGSVYRVMDRLKESSISTQGIPIIRDVDIPVIPPGIEGLKKNDLSEHQKRLYWDWAQMASGLHRFNERQRSKRIQFMRTLMMAEQYMRYKKFWYVWQADFRGRLYPCFSFLSPQGPDYSRSLLKSAQGLPLVDDIQIRSLAIQGANVYGEDKVSLDERYGWVLANEGDILRVAEDPYDFDWWQEASEPWGFLAFCFEWAGFVKRGKGFISSLFCQTDGSQNGIQHYAALLKDAETAEAVNLVPLSIPLDLYEEVAIRVKDLLKNEKHDCAREWENSGLLNRKLGKKPCMVFPYGGTLYSTKEYIKDYIQSETLDKGRPYPFDGGKLQGIDPFKPASFIGPFVKQAIEEVCTAAARGMAYFQDVSQKISKEAEQFLEWTSPSGFRVIQFYPKIKHRRIRTVLYGNVIAMRYQEDEDKSVNSPKSRQSTPPNVIHSFDAAHLHLTLAKCKELSITQVNCVHDSYGAVASQLPLLNQLLRESFVEMYSQDVLGDWHEQMLKYGVDLPDPPTQGNLDISLVRNSDFFFC